MAEPLIELVGVSKTFKRGAEEVHALRDVNLRVSPGEFVVVTGPSGSGKSTLLHVLAGLDSSDEGSVRFGSQGIDEMSDDEITLFRRRNIGFVFQFFYLLPTLTTLENVALPLIIDSADPTESRDRAATVLASLGLGRRAQHLPRELSGGEQQRVALARAMVANPSVILADEPTGNLDSRAGAEVYRLLSEIPGSKNTAVVMVSHDPKAMDLASRRLYMEDGQLSDERAFA